MSWWIWLLVIIVIGVWVTVHAKNKKEKGADVNATGNNNDETQLFLAARFGQVEVAKVLIEHGVDVNAKNGLDWTPLHVAAGTGQAVVAKILIEHGADVNAKHKFGWVPLYHAHDLNIIEILEEAGARWDVGNINAEGIDGSTPLHMAAGSNQADVAVIKILIEHGADVNAKIKQLGWTPLHMAYNAEVANLLIAQGANVNAKDNAARTPLDLAEKEDREDVVKILKANGAKHGNELMDS